MFQQRRLLIDVRVMYQIREFYGLQIMPCKYRRKIKKKGLNIWTNAETGQDRKGLVFNMFLEIFESKEEKRKLRKDSEFYG